MLYFDNNANIPMTDEILKQYCIGAKLGNISNQSQSANIGQFFKRELTKKLNTMFPDMKVIFTSGGSESNSTVIRQYMGYHYVCSTVEHSSVIKALDGENVSWVKPKPSGHIPIGEMLTAVGDRTKLIIMQSINSETGAIQDLMNLAVHNKSRIPIHCDHVQGFMKLPEFIAFVKYCNRASQPLTISVSFHKIGAPIGFGALITNTKVKPLIAGIQNDGLRGGTYNAAAMMATDKAMQAYDYNKIRNLRQVFDNEIQKHFIVLEYTKLVNMIKSGASINSSGFIIMISCDGCLPHTIFFAICEGNNTITCNAVVRDVLAKNNIVVGLGSACNSEKKETMGSMRSADIPEEIKNGFIRVSLSCYNTVDEVKKLVKVLSVFSKQ